MSSAEGIFCMYPILFASDYPYDDLKETVRFVETLPICDSDKHKICHANTEALLGIRKT